MSNQEIKLILGKIVSEYVNHSLDNKAVVEELINNLNPEEIYEIEDDKQIVDCYYAIKHLCEYGYETTYAEMKYFDDCFNGKRKYVADEKNIFILSYN